MKKITVTFEVPNDTTENEIAGVMFDARSNMFCSDFFVDEEGDDKFDPKFNYTIGE
jgi:hypothetical protein